MPIMSVRAAALLSLLVCAGAALPAHAAEPAAAAQAATVVADPADSNAEWAIRAGDTRLRVRIENPPDAARVAQLRRWIDECANAALTSSGRFPLRDALVRIRLVPRRGRDSSPVPWGQTRRDDGVSVLLYVRDDATYQELRDDWTAVHELSHLMHPYLGDDGRWLAEGLASYYQNVSRARAGLLDGDDAWRRIEAGFQRGRKVGAGARMDQIGRSRGSTMRVYWAGAALWLDADLALRREQRTDLDRVLAQYARCCLDGNAQVEPEDFVAALDRAGGNGVLARLYRRYAAMQDFPSQDEAYRALGLQRADNGELRFSDRPDALRLRRAIMAPRSPQRGE
ncbi:hypothetical protein [Lysobacter sp. Root690]|uniref:hypothetical protein n=1 Tax=Lysobacter sp. Root690 TaxID=1736588 RepID=UPI0006F55FEF|nr:hypothetical protein [Lysobacter sp. Root690]KRB08224.1 hypothetical protein ASD86_10675 [Lysobacter sp. Root690]